MRMPGETGEIILGIVVAEIVEEQEGIGQRWIAEAESAVEMHAGAFKRRLRLRDLFHRSDGHGTTPWFKLSQI
jgi:hypothetical protein